jgi:cysteinyl-tRNA synthetase
MKLYNTLSRSKEDFIPLKDGHVKLYTCGPTVYSYLQIGNLLNIVFNDTLKRVLTLEGYTVDHIMNITDVGHLTSDADEGGDKLQNRAAEEGKTVWQVAEYYTQAFKHDARLLNVIPPVRYVPATTAIDQQIEMVTVLIEKGFAYQADQAIYFDVSKLPDYGKLTGQTLDQKEVGARSDVVTDPEKRNPQDFALWFFTVGHFKDHEMRWESPWGKGFPGWHLECSAIIEQELGTTIDIHTGGVDHIGTHHTNEIAQSEAAHDGAPLANYWVHNEHLLIDGKKISKSLGNGYVMKDILDKGYDPMALRLFYLQSHYRTQQNFSWELLDASSNLLKRFQAWSDTQFQDGASTLADDVFDELFKRFEVALADDLNTPQALVIVSQIVDITERDNILPTAEQVAAIDSVLGLGLTQRVDITPEEKQVLQERQSAREARDYAAADSARDKLLERGIMIDDTPYGPRWSRVS